jgi:acetolactate synthase-1/2/3 large subunit
VLLRVAEAALGAGRAAARPPSDAVSPSPDPGLAEAVDLFRAARHPVLFVGQGAALAAAALRRVAEARRAPVLTTPSGRGALPEDHALSFGFDPLRQDVARVNAFLEEADLIVAVGCKLTHNGTAGFTLSLPAQRLIHVDTGPDVLGANYAARLTVCASAEAFFSALEGGPLEPAAWPHGDLHQWRERVRAVRPPDLPEPAVGGGGAGGAQFFATLRRGLPREAIVVTDSGMHQVLTRRYYDVWAPAGLLMPSDFQSMGFGVPAAIGAALAAPTRPVVAIVGDGGLRMTGLELATAVREGLRLVVFVFSDGRLNQIRLQQLTEFGHEHAVELAKLDLGLFAEAVGAGYARLTGDLDLVLARALAATGPTLVEVPVSDSPSVHAKRVLTLGRTAARRALGPRLLSWLRKLR